MDLEARDPLVPTAANRSRANIRPKPTKVMMLTGTSSTAGYGTIPRNPLPLSKSTMRKTKTSPSKELRFQPMTPKRPTERNAEVVDAAVAGAGVVDEGNAVETKGRRLMTQMTISETLFSKKIRKILSAFQPAVNEHNVVPSLRLFRMTTKKTKKQLLKQKTNLNDQAAGAAEEDVVEAAVAEIVIAKVSKNPPTKWELRTAVLQSTTLMTTMTT
ncbi:MAG: hypothetical protein KDA91_05725 [Planctomycetaceae bacterium]|nr:hypothetical protein [Planctomycetaceae bacterium]